MSGDRQAPAQAQPLGSGVASENGSADAQPPTLNTVTVEGVLRPLAIAGMLTCLAVALAQLMVTAGAQWPGTLFVLLTFAVTLESIYAQHTLSRIQPSKRNVARFRFVEWVVVILLLRFSVYLQYGPARLAVDVASWTVNIGTFFDVGFILTGIILTVLWWLAYWISETLQEMQASKIEEKPRTFERDYYLRSTMPGHGQTDRQSRLNRIVQFFFWGGAILLFLTALNRVDVRDLIVLRHGRSSGIILNVLIYFLLGFLLISQAHFTILKATWQIQGIPVLGRLGRRWMYLVLAFLGLIGLVAALLPVGYSVGILDVLFSIVQWIGYAIVQTVFFVLFILSYAISLVISLFRGKGAPGEMPQMEQAAPPPPPPAAIAAGPSPWWQVVRSLLFWAILTGVMGYSLFHFLGDRWGLFQGLSATRFFTWLRRVWHSLLAGGRRVVARLAQAVSATFAPRPGAPSRAWGFLSLRRLTPRDRVRYFYLSTLRRSAQQGFGRPPTLTPLEYEQTLEGQLPEVSAQVHDLTQAFVEARYSEHSISKDDATRTQSVWQRIKQALTFRRRTATQADAQGTRTSRRSADRDDG